MQSAFAAAASSTQNLSNDCRSLDKFQYVKRLRIMHTFVILLSFWLGLCPIQFECRGSCWQVTDEHGVFYAVRALQMHREKNYKEANSDFLTAIDIFELECSRHKDYAWLLATCPDKEFRDGKRAVEHAIRHLEIAVDQCQSKKKVSPKQNKRIRDAISQDNVPIEVKILFIQGWNWDSLETLAAALAENGEFERAVIWQQLTIDTFTSDDGRPIGHVGKKGIDTMKKRLELYSNRKKLRASFPPG